MMTERLINFQYDGESDPYAPNMEIIINSPSIQLQLISLLIAYIL